MKSGRSPGNDGITIECYKKYWKVIKNDFSEVVRYILIYERLSPSQYEGTIKLGLKGGDPSRIDSKLECRLQNYIQNLVKSIEASDGENHLKRAVLWNT